PLKEAGGIDRVLTCLRKNGVDGLVAIGGDDTLSVARALHESGYPIVGVPKTIDNDLSATDFCIGFDTAVGIVVEALDRLHTTASAHHRVMVVEVMGRDTGWVAMMGGLAGGADLIVIPEFEVSLQGLFEHLRLQRGGTPSAVDRIWALRLGTAAADLLTDGNAGVAPVRRGSDVAVVPLGDLVGETRRVPKELYELSRVFS